MNIIKTVGDLKKALSVYEDDLVLNVVIQDRYGDREKMILNNDTQLYTVTEENDKYFVINLGFED